MATPDLRRKKVFISYSHKDAEWLERLRVHLMPLERDYDIDVWDDSKISPGLNWREEIKRAVESAKVAVLLVSADFLASKFIAEDELPPLLRAAKEQGATILSVILSPSRFTRTVSLSQFQAVNHPSNPIINMPRGEQEEIFVQVSEAIEGSLNLPSIINAARLSANTTETLAASPQVNSTRRIQATYDEPLPLTQFEPPQLKKVPEPNTTITPSAMGDNVIDLAVQFDNYQTVIYRNDQDIVVSEPSIIAINALTNTIEAVGRDAEKFFYGVSNIAIYRPIKDGKITDRRLAEKILRYFINKACGGRPQVRPRVVIAVPPDLTQAERRALISATYGAKAAEVYLVGRILCAAIGVGITTRRPHGNMTVYVSESAVEIIAISHDGHSSFQPEGVACSDFGSDIAEYIRRRYSLQIGEQMAEGIKVEMGSAFPLDKPLSMEVRGLNLIERIPKTITITDEEVRMALADSVSAIVSAVKVALERTPRELAVDVVDGGIILTGAVAQLKRLDKRLSVETGFPVSIANDPESCVLRGAGRMLSDFKLPVEERFSQSIKQKIIKAIDKAINPIASLFSSDLAIDIGSRNTLVFARGRGIVVSEPSIVAINKITNAVEAVGRDAKEMLGRSPGNIAIVHPIKAGIIINSSAATQMLWHFIRKAHNGKSLARPRVVIPIPTHLSKIERQAFTDIAYEANAAEVYTVEESMCAAIGAGLPITEPHGNMIVGIGGGKTEMAIVSLSGIVYSRFVRAAGNEMDEAIMQYIKRKYNLLIGERTAEMIKIELGSALFLDEPLFMEVRGRNLIEGIPKTIKITDDEVREALSDSVTTIVNAVRVVLERTPPDLAADIIERGIVLTGGGAFLKNLDKRLSIETGLPVSLAEDPLSNVVLGTGKMLADFNLLKRVKWDEFQAP